MYDITQLTGPDGSEGVNLNSHGDAVGLAYLPFNYSPEGGAGGIVGAIWHYTNSSVSTPILLPSNSQSFLCDINDDRIAVGVRGIFNTPTQQGILVHSGHPMIDFTGVKPGSLGRSINNHGTICGWEGIVPLGIVCDITGHLVNHIKPLPGMQSCVAGTIDQQGHIGAISEHEAFVFRSGVNTDCGPAAFIADLNNKGQLVGSLGKPYPQSFMPVFWQASANPPLAQEIPIPPGFLGGHGEGINDNGVIVGTCWTQQSYNGDQTAFIHSPIGSVDLNKRINSPDWKLQYANKINNNGQIVGTGLFKGKKSAFLLTPQPYRSWVGPIVGKILLGGSFDPHDVAPVVGPIMGSQGELGWMTLSSEERDILLGLAINRLARSYEHPDSHETVQRIVIHEVRAALERMLAGRLDRPLQATIERPAESAARQPQEQRLGKPAHLLSMHGPDRTERP
jgi:hypothetical protein